MFANYDYSNFPEVKVTFEGTIKDKSDFINNIFHTLNFTCISYF